MATSVKLFFGFIVVAILGFLSGRFVALDGFTAREGLIAAALALILAFWITRRIAKKLHWYEGILDAIPFPISVTDKNRNWTFVNAAVEGMLKKSRASLAGQPCSSWGAGICNTDNCGINCLECGKTTTFFSQAGMDFKVYIGYLKDPAGRTTGHIEIVEDMTELFKSQKADAEMTDSISSTVVDLSGSVAEVADKTAVNASLASKAAAITGTMKENADKGSGQMKNMIEAVSEIRDAAQTINKVIKTINDIAFQTNLLALNASVEAARAGEAGAGFAVVADEVRNLATRSAQAANDTSRIIGTSIEKSELGYRIAGETSTSLSQILEGLTNANQIVNEIACSSEEQAAAIQSANSSLQRVSDIVQRRETERAGGTRVAGYLE